MILSKRTMQKITSIIERTRRIWGMEGESENYPAQNGITSRAKTK